MTTIPRISLRRIAPRLPAVSHLPPECRGSSFSFAPAVASRDCCHCAEYGELRDDWMEHPSDLEKFHALVDHVRGISSPACPTCAAVAADLREAGSLPTMQAQRYAASEL